MKKRDQKQKRLPRPYKRALHFSDGEVWSYHFANGGVAIRTPDCKTTHRVPLPEISGLSWDEMERGEWKGWWTGIGPQCVKDYVRSHLRPDPNSFPLPTLLFMHPRFHERWHLFQDCHFLPHRKTGQICDPMRVFAEDLEEHLGKKATLLNLCGVCMNRFQKRFRCMDCRTSEPEYYMVWDKLWEKAVPDGAGQLCFSCLGKRLGRPLRQSDFPPHIPVNQFDDTREHIGRLVR